MLIILWNRSCSGARSILSTSEGEIFSFNFCSRCTVVSRQYSEVVMTLVILVISCFVYLQTNIKEISFKIFKTVPRLGVS